MSLSLCCVPLIKGSDLLFSYEQRLPSLRMTPLEGLARAIAASPCWLPNCITLVLRPSPLPILAVLGEFDEAALAWLQCQIISLQNACRNLLYISYSQVEADCLALADRLREHLHPEDLARATFIAIPRGGLIILGLLASILGIRGDQISRPGPSDSLVIVVDDCALTGARFRRFLQNLDHENVIFATLYSPPELREAILRRENRVSACVSAQDIAGHSLHLSISDEAAPVEFYWAGQTEALCFPWNEPDRTVWNPETRRWDLAWRIVPPELCLKNRPAPGHEPVPIQIQPEGKGPLRPSGRALFAETGESITLFDLETGQGFSLAGTGSDLWRALLRQGGVEVSVKQLAEEYDVSPEILRTDSDRFVEDLLARGLLEWAEGATSAPDS
jgi:hypothetical protein